jgi:hypothetical protein
MVDIWASNNIYYMFKTFGLLFSMSHLQIKTWDYKRWEIHLDQSIKSINNKYLTTNQFTTPNHNILYTNIGIESCSCQHGIYFSSSKPVMQHTVKSSVVHRNVHMS